jgi:hypothetical protein
MPLCLTAAEGEELVVVAAPPLQGGGGAAEELSCRWREAPLQVPASFKAGVALKGRRDDGAGSRGGGALRSVRPWRAGAAVGRAPGRRRVHGQLGQRPALGRCVHAQVATGGLSKEKAKGSMVKKGIAAVRLCMRMIF